MYLEWLEILLISIQYR